jgi:hypothetical protein
MKHKSVTSTNIQSIGYEDTDLEVTFKGGSTYRYSKVPKSVYDELMSAESIGSYFAKNIKNNYTYIKVC